MLMQGASLRLIPWSRLPGCHVRNRPTAHLDATFQHPKGVSSMSLPACGEEPKATQVWREFSIDANGHPVLHCPDGESQGRAVRAMEEHPDVSVRVRPKVEEA